MGGQGLQIDEASVAEVADLAQRTQVARHVGADFEHIAAFEQLQDGFGQRNPVEPEEVADRRRGELQQRHAERHAGAERGARLGVEADQRLSGEALASLGDVALVLDEADLPPELDGRKQGGLLVADFIDEIVYSGHAVKIPTNLRNYFHKSCLSYD